MTRIADASERLWLLSNGKLTLDILANLLTGGGAAGEPEWIYTHKGSRAQGVNVSAVLGAFYSLFQYDGTPLPGAPNPGAFAVPTNTSQGGLMQANPGGGRKKLITSIGGSISSGGMLVIYDRLAHCSGLNGTLLTAQNINGGVSGDVTRYTNGVGNQLWIEIYTALGATATTLTAQYKDGAGATQTSLAARIGNTNLKEAQRIIPIPLVSGGSTVIGCTSVTLAASTLTAGDFGITIAHPLAYIPISATASSGIVCSFLNHPIVEVLSGACLAMAFIPAQAIAPSLDAYVQMVEV